MSFTLNELIAMYDVPGMNREQIVKDIARLVAPDNKKKVYAVLGDVARSDDDNIHAVFYCRKRAEEHAVRLGKMCDGYNSFSVYELEVE